MSIVSLQHVQMIIPAAKADEARRFYGELLGLEEIERPDFGFPGAWYQAGPIQVHLIVPPTPRESWYSPSLLMMARTLQASVG